MTYPDGYTDAGWLGFTPDLVVFDEIHDYVWTGEDE